MNSLTKKILAVVVIFVIISVVLWVHGPFINVATNKKTYELGEEVKISYSIFYLNVIPRFVCGGMLSQSMSIVYENGTTVYLEPVMLCCESKFYINEAGEKFWDQGWWNLTMDKWYYPNVTGTYTIHILGRSLEITIS